MQNSKERKIKKKLSKRKNSEDEINILEQNAGAAKFEEFCSNNQQFINESNENIISCLDVLQNNNSILKGRKGHTNFYSKQVVSTGAYYFEVNILSMDSKIIQDFVNSKRNDDFSKKYYDNIIRDFRSYMPNIRIGVINTNGDKDLALGADEYSYGYRASDGALINEGEYLMGNQTYSFADTIGVFINLKPPMPDFLKNTINKGSEKNNECFVKFFKNGIEESHEFRGIFEGNYHAAITLYNYPQVQINFGPNFKYFHIEENRKIKSFSEAKAE